MGLLDNIFETGRGAPTPFSKTDAFAGILLAASASDGHIAEAELKSLRTITLRMRLFEGFSTLRLDAVLTRLQRELRSEGGLSFLKRCAAVLPSELHVTVFANACDIVLADGIVEPAEKEFLETLIEILQIDPDAALNIVEVMIWKNRG